MEYAPNINYLWTTLLIEELIRSGCTHFVIAPGSRSTPLVAAVATNKKATHAITFDERSAGFYALGHAKVTGYPCALIVTSGTAVANLMPAVVEASLDRIPMLILSADRPWELRDVSANQTIYQSEFFGSYARWFFELPCPNDKTPYDVVLSAASYAVWQSRYPLPGPVHLNCLFREPLAPNMEPYESDENALLGWHARTEARTFYDLPKKSVSKEALRSVSAMLEAAKNGLLVVGDIRDEEASKALLALGKKLCWPIHADIASGLHKLLDPHIIKHDQYLFQHADIKALDFDVVLQVGGRLIAKPVEELLKNRRGIHIFVDDHHKRSDPGLSVTHRLDGDIELFARELTTLLAKKPSLLLPIWLSLADKFDSIITDLIKEGDKATEPFVAHHISQVIDKQCMLMACTSMPIRDYHFFARYRDDGGPKIVVNRGTSGIDGLISTAIGFSHASKKRCTVLIGDLAFMHDANALALLQQLSVPMCIVAINNQGGAIFSFLPVAKFPHILTPFIDTPHDHDLAYFAKVFHIKHCLAITKTEFIDSYKEAKKAGHHIIIEVRSDKESNFLLHERIKKALLSLEGLPPVCR